MILVVEDNPADVKLLEHAFGRLETPPAIAVAKNGIDALAFVDEHLGKEGAPQLDLILMDIGLPRMGGLQVLEKMKSDASKQRIPIIMMSSSDNKSDVTESYKLHASAYVVKPPNLEGYIALAQNINGFWFRSVTLPFA